MSEAVRSNILAGRGFRHRPTRRPPSCELRVNALWSEVQHSTALGPVQEWALH